MGYSILVAVLLIVGIKVLVSVQPRLYSYNFNSNPSLKTRDNSSNVSFGANIGRGIRGGARAGAYYSYVFGALWLTAGVATKCLGADSAVLHEIHKVAHLNPNIMANGLFTCAAGDLGRGLLFHCAGSEGAWKFTKAKLANLRKPRVISIMDEMKKLDLAEANLAQ